MGIIPSSITHAAVGPYGKGKPRPHRARTGGVGCPHQEGAVRKPLPQAPGAADSRVLEGYSNEESCRYSRVLERYSNEESCRSLLAHLFHKLPVLSKNARICAHIIPAVQDRPVRWVMQRNSDATNSVAAYNLTPCNCNALCTHQTC